MHEKKMYLFIFYIVNETKIIGVSVGGKKYYFWVEIVSTPTLLKLFKIYYFFLFLR